MKRIYHTMQILGFLLSRTAFLSILDFGNFKCKTGFPLFFMNFKSASISFELLMKIGTVIAISLSEQLLLVEMADFFTRSISMTIAIQRI